LLAVSLLFCQLPSAAAARLARCTSPRPHNNTAHVASTSNP
jgi:hypothetical protein